MCIVLVQLYRPVDWWIAASSGVRVYWLGVSVIAGAAAYFVVLLMFGMRLSQFRMRSG